MFEAESRVGGKVNTFRREPNQILIERGPVVFTKFCKTFLSLLNKFQLTSRILQFNQTDNAGFDPFSGSVQVLPEPMEATRAAISSAINRYIGFRSGYKLDFETGYLNASPELFVPFSEWLQIRNLSILAPLFVLPITVLGYGDLDDTPALYVLKIVDEDNLLILTGQPTPDTFLILGEGLSALVEAMSKSVYVYLNHRLTSLHRIDSNLQELYFNAGSSSQKCQRVILAFPPLFNSLGGIIQDLSVAEGEVLREVKVHKYTSGGHRIPALNRTLYFEAFLQPDIRMPPQPTFPLGRCEVVGLAKQSTKVK